MIDKVIPIKAVAHCVVIKTKKVEEKSDGGIVLPNNVIERETLGTTEGVIIDMGPTAYDYLKNEEHPEVGDQVYFKRYAGIHHTFDDIEYRVIHDIDVYAKKNQEPSKGEDL